MAYEKRTVLIQSVKGKTVRVYSVNPNAKYTIPTALFPESPKFGEIYEFQIDEKVPAYTFKGKLDAESEISSLYERLSPEQRHQGNPLFNRLRELQSLEAERMRITRIERSELKPGEGRRILERARRALGEYGA